MGMGEEIMNPMIEKTLQDRLTFDHDTMQQCLDQIGDTLTMLLSILSKNPPAYITDELGAVIPRDQATLLNSGLASIKCDISVFDRMLTDFQTNSQNLI